MIEIEPIEDEDNFAFSTIVTYPRKTQISHGMYTNKVDMMNMITMIKTNIVHKDTKASRLRNLMNHLRSR
jgi:hypothetical protein